VQQLVGECVAHRVEHCPRVVAARQRLVGLFDFVAAVAFGGIPQ